MDTIGLSLDLAGPARMAFSQHLQPGVSLLLLSVGYFRMSGRSSCQFQRITSLSIHYSRHTGPYRDSAGQYCLWLGLSLRSSAGPGCEGSDSKVRPAEMGGPLPLRGAGWHGYSSALLFWRRALAFCLPVLPRRCFGGGGACHNQSSDCRTGGCLAQRP